MKNQNTNKKREIILIWKGFQYLYLAGIFLGLVFSVLLKKNYFLSTYLQNIYLSIFIPFLFTVLSIMIIIGIRKKIKIGYYASIAYLVLIFLALGYQFFTDFSVITVFALVVHLMIFYYIHKERDYFGIIK